VRIGGERVPLDTPDIPQTRPELEDWIRAALPLSAEQQRTLSAAIEAVFGRQQRLWQESKEEAIRALVAGFSDKLARLRDEISQRDATVSSIATYFEGLVGSLTEKSNRDPRTKLMNLEWFMSQLESFLELEQRVRWSAIGLADIHGFKRYNDVLGHAVGDRIIERVAALLSEQVRSKGKALARMLELVEQKVAGQGAQAHVAIAHGMALDEALAFRKEVVARLGCAEPPVSEVGTVLGAHLGPGVVAIAAYV